MDEELNPYVGLPGAGSPPPPGDENNPYVGLPVKEEDENNPYVGTGSGGNKRSVSNDPFGGDNPVVENPPYTPGEDASEFPGGSDGSADSSLGGIFSNLPKAALDFFKGIVTGADGKPNPLGIMALAGLLSQLGKGGGSAPVGYTGGIPSYTAVRQQVQYNDPYRRPGSGGRQYFTPMQTVQTQKTPAETSAAVEAARTLAKQQAEGIASAYPKTAAPQVKAEAAAQTKASSAPVAFRSALTEEEKRDPLKVFAERAGASQTQASAIPYYMQEPEVDEQGRVIRYPSPSGYRDANTMPPPAGNVRDGIGTLFSKENAPPRFTMEDVKAANPQLDWSKYNPAKLTMDVDDYQQAINHYRRYGTGMPKSPEINLPTDADMQQAKQQAASTAVPAASGGLMNLAKGRYLSGSTDGMADKIPANIEGKQPARLSHGEFVVPADVVSHLGNGNSEAGAERLYNMMDRIRKARTGTTKQGKQINPDKYTPA